MKKIKKFNENWIDDETEDTNRRMSELDDKDFGVNGEDKYSEEFGICFTEMGKEIKLILDKYKEKYPNACNMSDINILETIQDYLE